MMLYVLWSVKNWSDKKFYFLPIKLRYHIIQDVVNNVLRKQITMFNIFVYLFEYNKHSKR